METGSTQPRGRGRGGRTAERTSGSISELRSTATRGERVEVRLGQNLVQPLVERMPAALG